MNSKRVTPEILAPVGDWNMLRAAVHNGADAVYLGMPGFNARGRAPTLEISELREMIEFAHLYGVRVFLAFNVLIFERELIAAEEVLREVLPLRPDALITQDIGLVRLIRKLAPEQVIHASTQMTVTNSEAIRFTEDLGMKRYVLGREVSIAELGRIRSETEKELEVFVHGALCVSYSGQCLTSESFGGRSANRGQCAQSCRLPYELIVDGVAREMKAGGYLVSPQDLCGLDDVPRLVELGIESFKIEGRLKSPAYVASATKSYKS
ncbi:MAG: peptidase U32 family protein, partial [Pseudomonadota bacterium]